MITRNFKLFLNAGKQIPLMINVSQYDHGEKWVFTLYDDHGQKYTPSTGAIVGIKADNLGIINTGTVNSAGQVEIMETQQMTAAAGKAVFELLIDGDTHGTANFIVLVEPKPGDQADMSTSDLSLLQQAINSIAIAGSGAPAVATLAADMTDEGKIYLYAGSETGYTAGDWYYYNGASWVDGGTYGGVVDATLTQPGQAADAKKVGDEINDLKSQIATKSGLTEEVKQALLAIANHIGAWTDGNSQSYISALQSALYPPANLVSISAVYTQSGTVYTSDSLDDLKADLVVTGLYDDSSSREITSGYTLSGELETGVSTITVAYGGKTTTFTVNVTYNDTSVVYRLPSPTVFNGSSTVVNTGVAPFRSDHDFTIVATFKAPVTQNEYCGVWSSGDGSKIYALRPSTPSSGIWNTYGGGKTGTYYGAGITVTSEDDVVRYVLRHKTGQKHEVFGSVNGTTQVNGTMIGVTTMPTSGVELRLGKSYSNNTYFTGTINEFIVYERALTDNEITTYLAG